MSNRYLVAAGALAAATAVALLGAVPVAGQAQDENDYMAPRTPWGDPDFQGSWENRSPVPLERPVEFGDRQFMTEEEAAARANRNVGLPDGEEGAIADDLVAADIRRVERSNNIDPNRPGQRISGAEYNAFWNAPVSPRLASRRTSQIVDPPNGRLPPYTREILEQWDAREAARAHRGEADSWADRNVMERCLLRTGLAMGEMNVPKDIYQTPGQIVFDLQYGVVRVVPLDGRPRLGAGITQWWGDSRGRWEGDTLVIETDKFNNLQNGGPIMPSHGGIYGHNPRPLPHGLGRAPHHHGAPAPHRAGHHRVRLHHQRPERVHVALDGRQRLAHGPERAGRIRIHLPRAQLRHGRPAQGRPHRRADRAGRGGA